jgi:hypothetical protein
MSRLRFHALTALLLIALGFNLGIGLAAIARAQDAQPTYLPLVAHGLDAQAPQLVTLIGHDTTFVNAALIPGTCRVILTYIDRANGNRLHVVEDVGDHLVEVPMPAGVTLAGGEPDFEFAGLKHASGFPIVVCGRLRVYANARIVDGGPFVLQRLDMPIPSAP